MMSSNSEKTILKCTPVAFEHIQKRLQEQSALALRITLKKAGCSGWLYRFGYGSQPEKNEIWGETTSGLMLLLPSKPKGFFDGATIDYVKSGVGRMLTCTSPNEGDIRCGCGESFTIEDSYGE